MDSYFTDPRGKTIRLEDSCWKSHILRRRIIMAVLRVEWEETIERPDMIYLSKIDPDADLYYKNSINIPFGGRII